MRHDQREAGTSLHCPRRAFMALRRSVAWLESSRFVRVMMSSLVANEQKKSLSLGSSITRLLDHLAPYVPLLPVVLLAPLALLVLLVPLAPLVPLALPVLLVPLATLVPLDP